MQRRRQVLEDGLHVDHLLELIAVADLLREHLEQRQVLLDLLLRVGPLHLHDDRLGVRHHGAVHLRDRAGGQRRRFDVIEHVLPRHAELLLHHLHDLLLGQRRHVVLELGELRDELGSEEVGTRREDLPELAERRAELLERLAHALRLALTADGAFLIGSAEELLQAVLGEDGRDLRAPRHQVRLRLDVRRARADHDGGRRGVHGMADPIGRVHDDHRAARVVADAVRHVAEQELLAPRHPRVPDDEDVDRGRLGRVDDRHRGIVVHHDVGSAALAGDPLRLALELLACRRGARALGRAELGIGRARRDHDLHQVQFRAVALGEGGRPVDGLRGGLGPIGADHHAADRTHRAVVHGRMMPRERRGDHGGRPSVRSGASTRPIDSALLRRSSSGVEQPPRKW